MALNEVGNKDASFVSYEQQNYKKILFLHTENQQFRLAAIVCNYYFKDIDSVIILNVFSSSFVNPTLLICISIQYPFFAK